MKLVVVFLMVLGALLGAPRPVRAELPPHDPAKMKPDPSTPKAQAFTPVYRGPMTFFTTEFGDTQSVLLKASTVFGYQLQDIITPWYNEDDLNISSPVLDPMATFYENVQPMTVPQEVVEKSIHWSPVNENIQSNVFCARIINRSQYSDADEDISSSGLQLSMNIPRSQELYEQSRKVNAMWGRHEFESVTPGYYDWNLPKELNSIKDASPYCMMTRPSKDFSELENPVTQLATFGGGSIAVEGITPPQDIGHEEVRTLPDGTQEVVFVLDSILPNYRVNLTEVSVDGNAQQVCNIGDCNAEEVDGTKYDFVKKLDDTRGLTFNFLPEHLSENTRIDTPEERAAKSVYQYTVFGITTGRYSGVELYGDDMQKDNEHPTNALQVAVERSKQMVCTEVPEEILNKYTVSLAGPKVIPLTKEQKENMSPAQLAAAEKVAKEKASKAAMPINQTCKPPEKEQEDEAGGWNCDTSVGEQNVPGLNREYGQTAADNWYKGCSQNDQNAWKQCHNDVIAKSKAACVDPIFALAIWLHESAASSYICGNEYIKAHQGCDGNECVQDFGQNIESIAQDFKAQLESFLNNADSYASRGCPQTMQNFVSWYKFGNMCYEKESEENRKFIDETYIPELQEIYSGLGGGELPSWPKGQCSN